MESDELIKVIINLTEALKQGTVSFEDVYIKVKNYFSRGLYSVDGNAAINADSRILAVLQDLAEALTLAFINEQVKMIDVVCRQLGTGIAEGRFGKSFFDELLKK